MSDLHAFARRLAESVAAHDPPSLRAPLPVGRIVQQMMPYRACRSALGLETAEEYELLLLRLVAEEGGLARTFPPESAERSRVEVASVLPDLAFLQELQDATVMLNLAAIAAGPVSAPLRREPRAQVADPAPLSDSPEDAAPPPAGDHAESAPELLAEQAPSAADPAPDTEPAVAEEDFPDPLEFDPDAEGLDSAPSERGFEAEWAEAAGDEPPEILEPASTGTAPSAGEPANPPPAVQWQPPVSPVPPAAETPTECPHCARTLPRGRAVRFCPSCGGNVRTRLCVACRAELEPEWRHCVMCGHPAGDASRFA